jgi:Domain of unknown function (DUF4157)
MRTPRHGHAQVPERTPVRRSRLAIQRCGDHPCRAGGCEDEAIRLQRAADGGAPAAAPAIAAAALHSAWRPLDPAVQADMGARLGHDFGAVRVHTDAEAAAAARQLDARAFTVGRDVVFAAGQFAPSTPAGRALLAHELAHVVQQRDAAGGLDRLTVGAADTPEELEAEGVAERLAPQPLAAVPSPLVQRQRRRGAPAAAAPAAAAPACPGRIDFSWADDKPLMIPLCGPAQLRTDAAGVRWSLEPDPTAVAPGTTIDAQGVISIGPAQAAGQLLARATGAQDCAPFERPIELRTHPVAIDSTRRAGPPGANDYGAVFEHVFRSADGNVASLEGVAVGERFTNVPSPTQAVHVILPPQYPFGASFTLDTATLTPGATDNWHLTAAGELGGNHDTVTIGQAGINVGRFTQSASNPAPPRPLPVTFTLLQGLHWYCPQAAAAARWRMPAFVVVAHSRTLRHQGGTVEFVTTVNRVEVVDPYAGPNAVFNLRAAPVSTPRSAAAPAPPRTVRINADTLPAALPAGAALDFSIVGPALGCAVAADPADDHAATLTVGQAAGEVQVQAADATGVNRARVAVRIT